MRSVRHTPDTEVQRVETSSWAETITRFWVTLFIILALLYGGLLVISRTNGFKELIQKKLSIFTDLTITIEQVRADARFNIIMENVVHVGSNTNLLPAIEIQQASLRWRWIPLIRGKGWPFEHITVTKATIRFTQSNDGAWSPLSSLNDQLMPWVGLFDQPKTNTPVPTLTEIMRKEKMNLTLEDISAVWRTEDPGNAPLALVEGFFFHIKSIKPFKEQVLWSTMEIGRGEVSAHEWMKNLRMEWIRFPDQDIVLRIDGVIDSARIGDETKQ